MVDPKHTRLGIARQCSLVSISRSSFYFQGKGESPLNVALMRLSAGACAAPNPSLPAAGEIFSHPVPISSFDVDSTPGL